MNVKGAVEAALFSASGPIRLSEIAEKIGVPVEEVRYAAKDLMTEYDERGSAITIVKVGSEFRMKLRDEYTDCAGEFAEPEMPRGMMKTLVTIAYNQPVMQSELCRNLGPRVYDDVRSLKDRGFVAGKHVGQSLELTTTRHFCEYFGVSSNRKEDIRKWIEENQRRNAE